MSNNILKLYRSNLGTGHFLELSEFGDKIFYELVSFCRCRVMCHKDLQTEESHEKCLSWLRLAGTRTRKNHRKSQSAQKTRNVTEVFIAALMSNLPTILRLTPAVGDQIGKIYS
jgi:hypothetical protein